MPQSPLYEQEESLGAKFSPFAGWQMPLEYAGGGVLAEHGAVRERVGLFDVSHLGQISVRGDGAAAYLNTRLTNDLGRIGSGQAQYTLLCQADGGVVDDMIAYLFSPDEVRLIPNAANCATVADHLGQGRLDGLSVSNEHGQFAVLAVQGPSSPDVVKALRLPYQMDYMAFQAADFEGWPVTVCRTGYTGETGFELVAPNESAVSLWQAILAAGAPFGIMAAGLGARDTLRTEMGYPLHGQDITVDIDAVQAGLGWAIGWAKPDFDGAQALAAIKADGPSRRLRGLRAQGRGIPRPGMAVVSADSDQAELGIVTSGTFSPTLRTGIALALIDSQIPLGAVVSVGIRGRVEAFDVVKPPFVTTKVRS